jgi:hypothetical protein
MKKAISKKQAHITDSEGNRINQRKLINLEKKKKELEGYSE